MPRDGSTNLPGGVVPAEPMNVGEVANPPFAVLPDPRALFLRRADRFAALAPCHELEPYLRFLARLTRAQHDIQPTLGAARLPPPDRLLTAFEHKMPPLSVTNVDLDETADATLAGLAGLLLDGDATTDASRRAAAAVHSASSEERRQSMRAVLLDEIPESAVAEHVLAAAALQVHFARLAARLDVDRLTRVADGACPACGGAPVASAVVGREGAHGTRFCTCSICQTEWHVPRIRCLVCGAEKGIAYQSIAGGAGTVMGETCEGCSSYVKMLHQHKDPALDPVADDVASLALDVVLGREGWQRACVNPFLLGY